MRTEKAKYYTLSTQEINVDFDSLKCYTQSQVAKHKFYLHLSRLIIEPEVTRSPTVKAAGKSSRCLRRLISHQSTRNRDSARILIPQHSPTYLSTATNQLTNNIILCINLYLISVYICELNSLRVRRSCKSY